MAIPVEAFVAELYRAVSLARLDTGRYKSAGQPLRGDIAVLQVGVIMVACKTAHGTTRKGKTMTSIRKRLLIGISAMTLAAGACAVQAAGDQPAGNGYDGKFAGRMQARMEKRAAELHDKLHLNASQEAAWTAYVARMKPANPPTRPDRAALDKMAAPERMEFMLARMKEHEQKLADRIAATKEFYAVLTPEQQKIFNDNFKFGMRRRHNHG